jgi:hypothetical protein
MIGLSEKLWRTKVTFKMIDNQSQESGMLKMATESWLYKTRMWKVNNVLGTQVF